MGAGIFKDIKSGCDKVVKVIDIIEPDPEWQKIYNEYYPIYKDLYEQLEGTFDKLTKVNTQFQIL